MNIGQDLNSIMTDAENTAFNELFIKPYSLKDDALFVHADDIEETHVNDDWDRI